MFYHLEFNTDSTIFKTTNAKLYVPIVTLPAEDNAKLLKLLGEVFKRSIYLNKYKVTDNKVVDVAANNEEKYIRELLELSYQGVKRLFVLAYNNRVDDGDQVYIDSLRVKIKNYNIEIDERNFMIS